MPDCPIPLMGRDLLTKLGPSLFLEGQRNHPHRQMILTENRMRQIEPEVEIEDLLGLGMQNIEVPDLAKDIQPVVTIQDPQEMAVHCRGHQSQIPRSEIGKGNHRADQEAKKAAYIPTDKNTGSFKSPKLDKRKCHSLAIPSEKSESEVTQLSLTLRNPMDCSSPGSSIQARVLEWVALLFSSRSSQPRDRTWVSRIAGRRFTI